MFELSLLRYVSKFVLRKAGETELADRSRVEIDNCPDGLVSPGLVVPDAGLRNPKLRSLSDGFESSKNPLSEKSNEDVRARDFAEASADVMATHGVTVPPGFEVFEGVTGENVELVDPENTIITTDHNPPPSLLAAGVDAVVAQSVARIFYRISACLCLFAPLPVESVMATTPDEGRVTNHGTDEQYWADLPSAVSGIRDIEFDDINCRFHLLWKFLAKLFALDTTDWPGDTQ